MGALVVCGVLLAAFFAMVAFRPRGVDPEVMRNRENLRRRNIWAQAGGLTYPHELADGRVRWYHVNRDPALDL